MHGTKPCYGHCTLLANIKQVKGQCVLAAPKGHICRLHGLSSISYATFLGNKQWMGRGVDASLGCVWFCSRKANAIQASQSSVGLIMWPLSQAEHPTPPTAQPNSGFSLPKHPALFYLRPGISKGYCNPSGSSCLVGQAGWWVCSAFDQLPSISWLPISTVLCCTWRSCNLEHMIQVLYTVLTVFIPCCRKS